MTEFMQDLSNPLAGMDSMEAQKCRSRGSGYQPLSRSSSRYYQRSISDMSTKSTPSPTDPEFTYQSGTSPKKRRLSWRRSTPNPLPKAAQGLVFYIYRTPCPHSKKTYDITLADRKTQAFHVTFPHTAFGLSSRPNILVQRGGSSGPVVGEVRFHSWNDDEIVLPLITDGVAKLSTDGVFKKSRKIRFEGRDWLWRHANGKADGCEDGVGEGLVNRRWKCTDSQGTIYAVMSRTASAQTLGSISITQDELEDHQIEALVVCAMAMLEKIERRGSASSSEGD